MFCSKCGNELKTTDIYCSKCGEKVDIRDDKKSDTKGNNISNSKASSNKKFSWYIIVIIILVIIIVLLLVNFGMFRKRVRNSKHFKNISSTEVYEDNSKDGNIISESVDIEETDIKETLPEQTSGSETTVHVVETAQTMQTTNAVQPTIIVQTVPVETTSFNISGNIIVGQPPINEEYVETKASEKATTRSAKESETTSKNNTSQSKKIVVTEQAPKTEDSNKGPGAQISLNDSGKSTENQGPGGGIVSDGKNTVNEKNDNVDEEKETEVKIKSTEKVTDTLDDDDYECTITLVKPIMQGKNSEETEILNSCIDELIDVLWEEVEGIVYDYDKLPKSVVFAAPTLGSISKTKILINLSGTITTRPGSTKSIKYRITYDREEENGDIVKVS